MEELRARHRKEQRDLQSQITQKKKSASKKTRKSVNDECTKLENDLKERQARELAEADGNEEVSQSQNGQVGNDEDDLLDGLIQDSKALNITSKPEEDEGDNIPGLDSSDTIPRKQNRQKARLARRAAEQEAVAAQAAEEAADMPNHKDLERQKMMEEFEKRGLEEKAVAANGHCMYSSVADQMRQIGRGLTPKLENNNVEEQKGPDTVQQGDYRTIRLVAATYISEHPDDFTPFLEESLPDYVQKVRDTGEWGGQVELMALAKAYGITINVLQGDGRVEKIEGDSKSDDQMWLAYYRHGFGLGEHYNSLRKTKDFSANASNG